MLRILQINTVIFKHQISEDRSQWSVIEMISSWNRCSTRLNFGPSTLPFYINDLPQVWICNVKLFPDGSLLFLTITRSVISTSNLNEDLRKIAHWAHQWKMLFNPDVTKKHKKLFLPWNKNDTGHLSQYFKRTLMQIWNLPIYSSSYENNMVKMSH